MLPKESDEAVPITVSSQEGICVPSMLANSVLCSGVISVVIELHPTCTGLNKINVVSYVIRVNIMNTYFIGALSSN